MFADNFAAAYTLSYLAMRASLPSCLVLAALLAAACSPSSEPASATTTVTPADSLPMDSSATLASPPVDSQPASGKAGLSFGGNMPLGGQHKSKASKLDALGGKPGTFQRRSPMLGLPNRGLFGRADGPGTKAATVAAPWDAYMACDASDAPAPLILRWEDDALELTSGNSVQRLAVPDGGALYLYACAAGGPCMLQGADGQPIAYPGGPKGTSCPEKAQPANAAAQLILCAPRAEVELRVVCGSQLVALSEGSFYEYNLARCGVALAIRDGQLQLRSACQGRPATCD